jgi:O-antigen ligase
MTNSLPQSELRRKLLPIEPLLNVIAVFILATIFLFWEASRAAYVLLALMALGYLVKYRPQMPSDHRLYSWPIIGYFTATFLSLVSNGLSDGGINSVSSRFSLLLIAIPVASIFYLSFDLKRNVWIKFAAGCIVMGGLAIVDILYFDVPRANGGHNAARFGFIALAMTSVVSASYHRFSQVKFGRAVFFLAVLMGVCAMILSGTRTSWLAGLVVIVVAMLFYLDRYSLFKRFLFALVLIGGIAIVSSSLPIVQKRIGQMVEMAAPYAKGVEQTSFSSLRTRVEAWKLAWHVGSEKKVFGFGPGSVKRVIEDYAQQNPKLKSMPHLTHIHNQFLQTFLTTGLVGVLSFLALITCHFWIFAKYLRKRYSLEVRCLALSGLLLLVTYLIKSIPGVPFYGKQYLLMYGFASASIWGSLLGALRESGHEAQRSQ